MLQIMLLLVSGVFAGVMAGMLGVGGGIIYVPAIAYILSFKQIDANAIPLVAVSTSLSIILVSITGSLTRHWKNKFIKPDVLLYIGIGGALGILPAYYQLSSISADHFNLLFFTLLLLVGAKFIFNQAKISSSFQINKNRQLFLVLAGLLAGLVSTFFGVGGGIIIVPILFYFFQIKMSQAIGTSSGFIFLIALLNVLLYIINPSSPEISQSIGSIYLPAFLTILPTAFIFNRIGANFTFSLNPIHLTRYFGIFLIIIAVYRISSLI